MNTARLLAAFITLATIDYPPTAQAQIVFSQTLTPGTTIVGSRPELGTNRLELVFVGTPSPLDAGTFTLTATGDINGPPDDEEFVQVFGEDGLLLGALFDGFNESGEPLTETGSITIPLSALSSFAADGSVRITVIAARGVFGATIDSATLAYPSSELVPCSGPSPGRRWKNHGEYVSAVVEAVEEMLTEGVLTDEGAEEVVVAAARSQCGKK